MANEQNLIPFVKGDPRRINKPKGAISTSTVIKNYFKAKMEGTDPTTGKMKKLTVQQRLVLAQIGQGLKGNTKAFTALLDRAEGKVAQPMEMSGKDGIPLMPTQVIFESVVREDE